MAGWLTPCRKLEFYSDTAASFGWPEHADARLHRVARLAGATSTWPRASWCWCRRSGCPRSSTPGRATRSTSTRSATPTRCGSTRTTPSAGPRDRRPGPGVDPDRPLRRPRVGAPGHPAGRGRRSPPHGPLAARRERRQPLGEREVDLTAARRASGGCATPSTRSPSRATIRTARGSTGRTRASTRTSPSRSSPTLGPAALLAPAGDRGAGRARRPVRRHPGRHPAGARGLSRVAGDDPTRSQRGGPAPPGVHDAAGQDTPIALVQRKNFAIWSSVFPDPSFNDLEFSTTTQTVFDYMANRGASFFTDIVDGTKLLRSQVEEALGELVANGLVISDSFAGLRALLTPGSRKTQAAAKRKHRQPVYDMASAGRWSLLNRVASQPIASGNQTGRNTGTTSSFDAESAEEIARILLKRYGVVFKRLLEREGIVLPWRVLLRIYHRLEARGELRGGRFVAGISGEQFALPEAVGMMRAIRRAKNGVMDFGFRSPANENAPGSLAVGAMPTQTSPGNALDSMVSVSAADPLNLVGIITPGARVTAFTSNRILYHNGEPVAVLESGETKFLVELPRSTEWKAKAALMRKATPPPLRSYLRRPA